MDTIDKPVPIKWNIIRVSGILLILWSLISLVAVYDQIKVTSFVDFNIPCAVHIIGILKIRQCHPIRVLYIASSPGSIKLMDSVFMLWAQPT